MNSWTPSLYLHTPFCRHKCGYCDFNSWVSQDEKEQRVWLESLLRRVDFVSEKYGGFQARTLFFGGGTPSYLSPKVFEELFTALQERGVLSSACEEFTIECNPEDFSGDFLARVSDLGVGRLSIGIQSFDDQNLSKLERQASRHKNLQALEQVAENWNGSWSLDLMYGLPGQELRDWKADLELALSFRPPHISAYQLTLSTPKARLWKQEDENELSDFFGLKRDLLGAQGYEHYESSNFCQPGNECLHNLAYWEVKEFIGLGPGAYGLLRSPAGSRFGAHTKERSDLRQWSKAALAQEAFQEERRTGEMHLKELFLMGLRLKKGVEISRLGHPALVESLLENPVLEGLLEVEGARISCTSRGSYLVDFIVSKAFDAVHGLRGGLDYSKIDPIFPS